MPLNRPPMKHLKNLLFLVVLFCLSTVVNAAYLDDWPDDALCGWMQQTSPPEYIIEEVKKRGILCTDGVASINPDASQNGSSDTQSTEGIEIYDIVFDKEILGELIKIAPVESAADFTEFFKEYQLAFLQNQLTCGFKLKRVVYENTSKGEIEDWNMAYGSLIINGSEVTLDGSWRMGGLSNDPKYMKDEVNLRLTRDGHIVGKMAYFHLSINNGEAPRKPLFIELKKHQNSKPLNYKIRTAAEYWIDVEDWAGGIMYVFNCKDSAELQKIKSAKEKAVKLYTEALAKEKAELRLLNKIYQPYVLGPNTVFKIDYLDGVFEAKSAPEDSKKLHNDELHKAHINGMINSASLDQSIGLKTLVSIRENEDNLTLVVSAAKDEDKEMDPLKEFAEPAILKCGKLPGFWWDKLSFVVSTTDIEIAKTQKCYFDFFNNQTNSEAKKLYRAILSASPSITSYLESNVDR